MDDYFDFIFGRLGFSYGSTFMIVNLEDGSSWDALGFGFYWKR